ncbi:MAG: UDP-N-acetylglucosamine 1-carboxyvinyltransferase, partial [Balneolia bacterium]|nr:UDP-N-acetylglucosamine 1-carboxyvinyltransferase [Balneolia bacterium]
EISLDKGYVVAKVPEGGLPGGSYTLKPSSVGATVNLLLAAVRGSGTCVIKNAAKEPDVVQLCDFLEQMGAHIEGKGTSKLTIHGVNELKGITFRNASDRIETGTYMLLAAMHPESDITLKNTNPEDLGEFSVWFKKTGADYEVSGRDIKIISPESVKPVSVITEIYPGFPTDLQAQWASLMTKAEGEAHITDTIYPDRFSYVPELARLGADVTVKNNSAIIAGGQPLAGTSVMSTDLRASVSLVMAAMYAEGTSEVLRVYHLDRGYEGLEHKLNKVGAKVKRVEE